MTSVSHKSVLESIEIAFRHFCQTGEPTVLRKQDIGYLRHALKKCGGNTSGHPLFAKWVIEGHGLKIESFLIRSKQVFDAYG